MLRPKLLTQTKPKKNDFTFWINFGLSPNLGLSEKTGQKSEVTQCNLAVSRC